jgi:hypothetical protein
MLVNLRHGSGPGHMVVPRWGSPLVLLALVVEEAWQILEGSGNGRDFALVELIEILVVWVKPDIRQASSWVQRSLSWGILHLQSGQKRVFMLLQQPIQPPMLLLFLLQVAC